jgi:choline dehydrogenase-like flavoprotein
MLIEPDRREPSSYDADVCIIGAGPAGLTIARKLAQNSSLRTLIVESGGERASKTANALNLGALDPESRHPPAQMYRERALGGSSIIWGGRCVPFDAIDFDSRPQLGICGWPITCEDVARYYPEALDCCEAGNCDFSLDAIDGEPMIDGFQPESFETTIERFSPPTNFWTTHRDLLAAPTAQCLVLTGTTCLELIAVDDRVVSATCMTRGLKTVEIRATVYVVAAGGLETTRLLLCSGRDRRNGLANASGALGRYYMCHLEGTVGTLALRPSHRPIAWNFQRTRDNIYARKRLRLKDAAQREANVVNMIFRPHHAIPADARHRSSVLSAMYLAKRFVLPEYRRKIASVELLRERQGHTRIAAHARNIASDAPRLLAFLSKWVRERRFAYRRLPYVAIESRTGRYPIDFNAEQTPLSHSRVVLDGVTDRLGMPGLSIRWACAPSDFAAIERTYRILGDRIEAAGIGKIDFDGDPGEAIARCGPVGGHHIGLTRMSASAGAGVVDRNCRLHDCRNVYIASSSVFPTSSHANPTLTIVALALRLAAHLGKSNISEIR